MTATMYGTLGQPPAANGSAGKAGTFTSTDAPPSSPAKHINAGATAPVTDPQGDSLQLNELSVGSGSGNQLTCFNPFDVSVSPGSNIGGCAVLSINDSVSGSFAPATNSLTTWWYDNCGNLVHNTTTTGWHTVGFTTLENGTLMWDAPWIVPTSGFCFGGTWQFTMSFSETFTDGQTLTDVESHSFPVSSAPPPPPPPGSTGVGTGGATVHNTTPCAGDPVNCASGNFSESYTDASVPGRGPSLDLTRTYNSLSASTRGIFGYGWSSSYEAHLTVNGDGSVTVTEADGSQVTAAQVGNGYSLPAWADSTVTHNGDGTWTFVRQQTTTLTFDSGGRLTAIRDRNGYTTTLAYNGSNQLSTVTDPTGRTLIFTFGSNGLVSQVADPMSQATTYGYDGAGNLTSVTDPLLRSTTFGYDGNHLLLTVTDPNQGLTTNVYDASARVTQQTDDANLVTHFAYSGDNYSAAGGTTTLTDPHGSVTVENFTNGVMMSKTVASGTSAAGTWNYQYDPNTFGVTSVTDPNNHATTATYDGFGNLLSRTDALNHGTTFTYNSFNEPLSVTDPAGIGTGYSYDANGNVLTKTVTGAGGSPVATTTYSYTDSFAGDLTKVTDPAGHSTDYSYSAQGDVASSTTHPASGVNDAVVFVYDTLGRKVCEASANATAAGVQCPPAGQPRVAGTTTWAYDAASQLISKTDPLGNTTSFTYDGDGNLKQTNDGLTNVTKTVYDADSRPVSVTAGFGTSAASTTTYSYDLVPGTGACSSGVTGATHCVTTTDPSVQITVAYLNARNEQIQQVQPSFGTSTTTYDPAGNVTTLVTAASTLTDTYDAANELTAIAYTNPAAGYAAAHNVTYLYDADGRRTSMTDGTGTTSYTYDTLERLASMTNGAGSTVGYGYDLDNEVTSIAYPGRNQTVTQTWDGAGREASVSDWSSHTTNFSYDANDNLKTEALPNATTITTAYDAADNLLSTKDATNASPTNPFTTLTYTYNADLQVQTEADTGTPGPASQSYTYDPVSRLASTSSTSFGYSNASDPTQFGTAAQTFNAGHELTGQSPAITRVGTASAGDSGTGATLTLTLPTGTAANDQILLAVTLPGSQTIKSTPTGYTAVGTYSSGTGASNVKLALYRRTELAGDSSVTVTFSKTFAKTATIVVYRGVNPTTPIDVNASGTTATGTTVTAASVTTTKANDQLVIAEAAESSSAGTWTPPSGMTTRVSQAGGPTTTGALADQSLGAAGATGSRTANFSVTGSLAAALVALQPSTTSYTYDSIGDRKTSGATALAYDQLGRMTAYGSTTYAYNGDGLRMSKTVGHSTEAYTWQPAGSTVVPLILVDGSVDYVYGPEGLPLEQINGSTTLYYLHDQLGSTRALVGSTGTVVASYTYGPYGAVAASTGTTTNPFGFAGSYTDSESGFAYLQRRYYDPATGVFASVDPLAPLTQTPFVYVNGDPQNKIDPDGLTTIGLCVSGSSLLGEIVGVTGSVCLQASSTGDVGVTATGGPMIGGGTPDLDAGPGVEISNANHISQLGGPFDEAGVSAAYGVGGYAQGFIGVDSCGNPIYGTMVGPTFGAGAEGHIGPTETVTASVNVPNIIHKIGSGIHHVLNAINPF